MAVAAVGGAVWARHYCRKRWRGRDERTKHDARPSSDDSNPDVVPTIGERGKGAAGEWRGGGRENKERGKDMADAVANKHEKSEKICIA